MMGSKQFSEYDEPANPFQGVRFLLAGFDSVRESKVRSKLFEGGGVDAVNYGPDCSHVIVDKIVYDDPICAAARRDGKILVTGIWVDHSCDVGIPVDHNYILYRPVRDLNGIPGAKYLVMCLTGYQRHDRDDIMTMVSLMGASFSKPLVANKVTHLICYKFEGEKYELAKKIKTMKLVNHRWLQDCLRAWELLPEADYAKSGYELEMEAELAMRAEAKDSEEETEDVATVELKNKSIISPRNNRVENKNILQSPEQQGVSRNSSYLTAFESFANVGNTSKTQSTHRKETDYGKTSLSRENHEHPGTSNSSCARSPAKKSSEVPSNVPDGTLTSEKLEHVLASASGSAKKSADGGLSKLSSKSMKTSLPLRSERTENDSRSPLSSSKPGLGGSLDSHCIRTPSKATLLHPDEGQTAGSPSKSTVFRRSSISPVLSHSPKTLMRSGLNTKPIEMPVSRSSIDGSCLLACDVSPTNGTSRLREEVRGVQVLPSEKDLDGIESVGVKIPDEEQTISLPGKKKVIVTGSGSKSTKLGRSPKTLMGRGSDTKPAEKPISGPSDTAVDVPLTNFSSCLREEVSGVVNMPSEKGQERSKSGVVTTPLKGTLLHLNEEETSSLPDKKKMTISRGSPRSKRLIRSTKTLVENGSDTEAMKKLVSGSSMCGAIHIPPSNITSNLNEHVSPASVESITISTLQEDRQEGSDQMLKRSQGRSKKKMSSDLDVEGHSLSRTKSVTGREEMQQQSDPPGIEPPFPSTSSRVEALDGQADLYSSKADHSGSQSKTVKKKMLARKTLGSRPTIRKGSTAKHKGLISVALLNELTNHSNEAVAIEDKNNVTSAEKFKTFSPTTNEDVPLGDETEAPECEEPNVDKGSENSAELEEPHSGKPTHKRKQPSEKTTQIKKGAKSRTKNSNEATKTICSQNTKLPESKSTDDVAEEGITEGKKRPLAKSKRNKLDDPTENKKDEKNTVSHNEEMVALAADITEGKKRPLAKSKTNKLNDPTQETKQDGKKTVTCNERMDAMVGKPSKRPSKKLKASDDLEKENEPVANVQQSVSCNREIKKPLKNANKADKANAEELDTKAEPAWFILSGHKLQRKEFQQVIKRLKGRVCRDTHNWSYQATHFIVPDPIRRTEKFFAAAASGSWILKTDYLTASNEAGRFLSEEPYEWHKKCLTEDGAINLEAPRKWRLLRERTGHGAFYGMQVIIYGECIAPPLDTLKRVVKAGDGTILATSPPYTRFLTSRVDFAIVSPGMPCVDMWVQEFLRHEIPCISADYLVEYVCKPGYSLERHVQFNTQALAQRSLNSLVQRVEEAVEDPRTPEDRLLRLDDAVCRVCGSRDRGEEMLICSDESGARGCGVGTHIDCLDPPLESVPEEDWFCGDCCRKSGAKTGSRSSKKRAKKSKK